MASYIKSSTFQDEVKRVTFQVPPKTYDKIAKNPQRIKDWILQVMNQYPDLLDDNGQTLQYIKTPDGKALSKFKKWQYSSFKIRDVLVNDFEVNEQKKKNLSY